MIQSEKDMVVLAEDFKQRAFDGKWERIVKILDTDNTYSYTSETGGRVTLIPERWVCVGVYDYLMSIDD